MNVMQTQTRVSPGGTQFVEVEGEVDLSTAPQLKDVLAGLIDTGHVRLAVKLEKVQFIDSVGLSVLLFAQKEVQAKGGRLVLISTNPRIHRFLALTGLSDVIQVCKDDDDVYATLETPVPQQ